MSDGDVRPRPQYGEYASPEEQRARIQRPEVTESLEAGVAPAPEASEASAAAVTPGPLVDRIVTFGLLTFGFVNVVLGIAQRLDFPAFANGMARSFGVSVSYTASTAGFLWSTVASVILGVGFLITAWLTWRRLRRGRIAFWVPLVGAVVTGLVAAAFVMIAFSSDPAYFSSFIGAFRE